MESKKGLSAVVTTLIIILLVLVAVGIIWVVVRNVVNQETEQVALSTKCLAVDVQAVSVSSTSAGVYDVTLNRKAGGEDIGGLKVVLFNATGNINSGIIDFGATISEGATVTQSIDTAATTTVSDANKLEYTVFFTDASGNEQLCPQTNEFEF